MQAFKLLAFNADILSKVYVSFRKAELNNKIFKKI